MGELQLRDVRKSYGHMEVIKGVNLDVDHGEFIVFVGPSGCGKSTTASIISRLMNPTSGDVIFDGQNITTPSDHIMLHISFELA